MSASLLGQAKKFMRNGKKFVLSSLLVLLLLVGVMGVAWAEEVTYTAPEGLKGWIVPDSSITPCTALDSAKENESEKSLTITSLKTPEKVTEQPAAQPTESIIQQPVQQTEPVAQQPVQSTGLVFQQSLQLNGSAVQQPVTEPVSETPASDSNCAKTVNVTYNTFDDGKIVVNLTSNKAISEIRDFTLTAPKRDVFDLAGLSTENEPDNISIGNDVLQQIRFGASPDDGLFRMVFDMGSTNSGYTCSLSPDGTILTITLTPSSSNTNVQVGVQKNMENVTVVLDPGHGGSDPGAVGGNGTYESHVNLEAAFKTKAYLESMGAKVIMTRESDVYRTLDERPALANENGADVFVSIHSNASANRTPGGTSTHYITSSKVYNGDQNLYKSSMQLAQNIQNKLVGALGLTDRGIESNNFAVLRGSHMPAVLVEMAFISNYNEEALLNTDSFRDKVGLSIAQGIAAYFGN